jgi:hypothetical protein
VEICKGYSQSEFNEEREANCKHIQSSTPYSDKVFQKCLDRTIRNYLKEKALNINKIGIKKSLFFGTNWDSYIECS